MRYLKNLFVGSVSLLSLSFAAGPALAQTTGGTGNPPSPSQAATDPQRTGSDVGSADIVVTATKREERLIETPLSVSVLSADSLNKLGATQFRDFADTVPGLNYQSAGAGYTQLSIRGITVGADSGPTVGVYVDDVPYGSSTTFGQGSRFQLDVGLFDIDRVEVLRGPQGTLYGASTMGGLIKYVSKAPDLNEFSGELRTGVSATEHGAINYNVSAVANLPIASETAGLRVSAFQSHDGGYIDNVARGRSNVNRSDIYGGRIDLLLKPAEALSIRLTGFLQNISRDGFPLADFNLNGTPVTGRLEQRRTSAEPLDQQFRLVSGTIRYDLGGAEFASITSYQTVHSLYFVDYYPAFQPSIAFLNLPISALAIRDDTSTDKFTQEFRLQSQGRRRLEWQLGAFYTSETSDRTSEFANILDLSGQPAQNTYLSTNYPSTYKEYAAFGDLTFRVTDAFDITGGVRYSRNKQRFAQNGSGLFGRTAPANTSSEDVWTYLANARYRFGDHATAYLRYATGYRPGGPNFVFNDPITGLPIGSPTFEADRLKSYEGGFKAETSDRRFGFDLAGYYARWENIQVLVSRNSFSAYDNAPGGASVRGAELTLTARPVTGFTATGAFAYQDARLSEASAALGALKGERLPNVPRFTAAVSGDYNFAVGDRQAFVGGTFRYIGSRNTSFTNNTSFPQYRLPSYETIDLRTGISLGNFDLQLYVHNLFDVRGQQAPRLAASPRTGPVQIAIIQPRTFGLALTTRF